MLPPPLPCATPYSRDPSSSPMLTPLVCTKPISPLSRPRPPHIYLTPLSSSTPPPNGPGPAIGDSAPGSI
ncbi:hypothetical protein CLOP_g20300 [Closterium sp. NIES-67]|nr:hypothetical protein CLOP_g20300 [Closterium sp. NIES-67]